jgi:Fanconi-associated nuclease 1
VISESALADEAVRTGARHALQRRVLRLAKPPRRWKKPACVADVDLKQAKVHFTIILACKFGNALSY